MMTPEFAGALDDLLTFAAEAPTAIMCAEAVWWRCHRALLADALAMRRVAVLHIESAGPARPHRVTEFARILEGKLVYPGLV
jgi:uncharacterized protein (DUF488 family)